MKSLLRKALWPLWCTVTFCLLGVLSPAWGQMYREAFVKEIPPLVANTFSDRGDGILWEGKIAVQGSLYLRLYFSEITSPPGARYTVVVRGADEKAIARYPSEEFSRARSFYTGVLFTDAVKVQVEGATPLTGLSFRIERVLRQVDLVGRLTPQSILPSWRSLEEVNRKEFPIRLGESVAKLYIGDGYVCTGFLISPNALLTNFHCLKKSLEFQNTAERTTPECFDIEIQFGFDRQPSPASSVRTRCIRVMSSDTDMDYALLEVDQSAVSTGKSRRGFVTLSVRRLSAGEGVFVIHHPGGLAKKVSLDCAAYPVETGQVLEHDCSTIAGSSGSPVIGMDGTVVGLHFAGAYNESMTVGEINELIAEGKVFRNKAKPSYLLRERLKDFIP